LIVLPGTQNSQRKRELPWRGGKRERKVVKYTDQSLRLERLLYLLHGTVFAWRMTNVRMVIWGNVVFVKKIQKIGHPNVEDLECLPVPRSSALTEIGLTV